MDSWHIIFGLLTFLFPSGLIPWIYKLHKDKKRLKKEQENIQNKKIEILTEILVLYIEDNGSSDKIKKLARKKLKELKEI